MRRGGWGQAREVEHSPGGSGKPGLCPHLSLGERAGSKRLLSGLGAGGRCCQLCLWLVYDMMGWCPNLISIKYFGLQSVVSRGEMTRDWTKCGMRVMEVVNLRTWTWPQPHADGHRPHLPLVTVYTPIHR